MKGENMIEKMKQLIEANPEAFKKVSVAVGAVIGAGVVAAVLSLQNDEIVPFEVDEVLEETSE
jgi:hypothetical protein